MLNEFKNKLFKKAKEKGFSDCEIYYQKGLTFKVNIFKGDIEKYQNSSMVGISFRGVLNNTMGYSYSEKISDDVIDIMIDNAAENAQIINNSEIEFIYGGDISYPVVDAYNDNINNISVDEKIKSAKIMEETILNFDTRIKACNSCVIANGEEEIYISNTKGLELNEKSNYMMAYVSAIAEDNKQTKTAGEMWFGNDWSKFNPVELAQKVGIKVLSYLGSDSINSGSMPVVIKNETFAALMSNFVGNFYAENMQKGLSLLQGKINQKIASEKVTIVDEPLLKGGFATSSFDSEGVASYNKVLIENGVFKTFLYNLKSASKDGVKSTGNGFKASFKSSIYTSATNLYIKNGNKEFNQLLNNMNDGIVVTELAGLHSGCNAVSGDFSLAASGFLVENGKIVKPVEQITIAGNFYEVLNNIIEVGNDLKFLSEAIGSPSIYIKSITVAGV